MKFNIKIGRGCFKILYFFMCSFDMDPDPNCFNLFDSSHNSVRDDFCANEC